MRYLTAESDTLVVTPGLPDVAGESAKVKGHAFRMQYLVIKKVLVISL